MQIKRQSMILTFIIFLIASIGGVSALTQSWNSNTYQPTGITSDGVNIYSADASDL